MLPTRSVFDHLDKSKLDMPENVIDFEIHFPLDGVIAVHYRCNIAEHLHVFKEADAYAFEEETANADYQIAFMKRLEERGVKIPRKTHNVEFYTLNNPQTIFIVYMEKEEFLAYGHMLLKLGEQ